MEKIEPDIFAKAADIASEIISQHILGLNALLSIQTALKNAEEASRVDNNGELQKIIKSIPPHYKVIAASAIMEARLIDELTRSVIGSDYYPENKTEALRGYV